MNAILESIDEQIAIQSTDGNWNYDAYMHGMLNGMILVRATLRGEKPKFKNAPKEWLCDKVKQ